MLVHAPNDTFYFKKKISLQYRLQKPKDVNKKRNETNFTHMNVKIINQTPTKCVSLLSPIQ